jgi:hypothetical protein
MATQEPHPKVFISYSLDDGAHREWVNQLAARLGKDGVDVSLDREHATSGDPIAAIMERAARESDFVIAIITPRFKETSAARSGGVGPEGESTNAHAVTAGGENKFIQVLRRGRWAEAAPTGLRERAAIDLRGDPYAESEYQELVRTLHGGTEAAPPTLTGGVPDYFQDEGAEALRARVEWLERQGGIRDAFLSRHLRIDETRFRQWRNRSAPLPPGSEVELRALWRTVQHLFSFLNFDAQRVKTLLRHRVPAGSPGPAAGFAPPWAGSSLIDYLEEHGPRVLPEVDRWVMTLRFGDPYVGTPAPASHSQPVHAH